MAEDNIKDHKDYLNLIRCLNIIQSESPDTIISQLIKTKRGDKPITFITNNTFYTPRLNAVRICKHINSIFKLKTKILEEHNFEIGNEIYPHKKFYHIIVAQDDVPINLWIENNCSIVDGEGNSLLSGLILGYTKEEIIEYYKRKGILDKVNINQEINDLDKLKEHLNMLRSESYFDLFKNKKVNKEKSTF